MLVHDGVASPPDEPPGGLAVLELMHQVAVSNVAVKADLLVMLWAERDASRKAIRAVQCDRWSAGRTRYSLVDPPVPRCLSHAALILEGRTQLCDSCQEARYHFDNIPVVAKKIKNARAQLMRAVKAMTQARADIAAYCLDERGALSERIRKALGGDKP